MSNVLCNIKGYLNLTFNFGMTALVIKAFISKGTPGKEIKTLLSFSNHIPGAVPKVFIKTVALEGTNACSILDRNKVCLVCCLNIDSTFSKTDAFITNVSLKYSAMVFLVISSFVGPRSE